MEKNYKENMNFKTEFKPVFIFQVVLNFKNSIKNSLAYLTCSKTLCTITWNPLFVFGATEFFIFAQISSTLN